MLTGQPLQVGLVASSSALKRSTSNPGKNGMKPHVIYQSISKSIIKKLKNEQNTQGNDHP